MKNILLLATFFVALVSFELNAQKLVLVEQVTSASCGPCAAQNPAFKTFLEDNIDDVAIIKYQRGSTGGYLDPMWQFNPSDVDGRIPGYYGVNSFPNIWVDGVHLGTPNDIVQSDIDNALSNNPAFDVQISKSLNVAQDELSFVVDVTALQDMQGSANNGIKVFIAVVETEVNYANPPGYNGEKDFWMVMRKMFPNYSGNVIGQQMTNDDHQFSDTYIIDLNEIDPEKLEVVAFVQNHASGEVYQAATTFESQKTTSVSEEFSNVKASLYPSISSGPVYIDVQGINELELTIHNLLGNEVYSSFYTEGNQMIDLNELNSGVYIASFEFNNEVISQRLVIQ